MTGYLHVGQTQDIPESAAESAPDTTAFAQNVPTHREDNPETPITDTRREPVVDVMKEVGFLKDSTKGNFPEVIQEVTVHNQQESVQGPHKLNLGTKRENDPDASQVAQDVAYETSPLFKKGDPSHEMIQSTPAIDGRTVTTSHSLPDEGSSVPSSPTQKNASAAGVIPSHFKGSKQAMTCPTQAQSSVQGHLQAKPSSSRPIGTRSQLHTPTQPVQHKPHQTAQAPKSSSRMKEEKTYVSKKSSRL